MDKIVEGKYYIVCGRKVHYTIFRNNGLYFLVKSVSGGPDEYIGIADSSYGDVLRNLHNLEFHLNNRRHEKR